MKWQRKRDSSRPNNSTASAADHVQSYWEYNRLVGESAGDRLLSEVLPTNNLFLCSVLVLQADYTELKEKAVVASKDRLYVSWRCNDTGMDCYNVGPGV